MGKSNLEFYRRLVIQNPAGKPTKLDQWKLERILGAKLPGQFRAFLSVGNGGSTLYSVNVPPTPKGEPIGFSEIYSTRRKVRASFPRETFIQAIERLREDPTVPRQVLPIARDGGGSEFYLDLSDDGYGRVVIFRHGLPAWTGRDQDDAYIELAKSFDAFIDSMYIEKEIARDMVHEAVESNDADEISTLKTILDYGYPDWRNLFETKIE